MTSLPALLVIATVAKKVKTLLPGDCVAAADAIVKELLSRGAADRREICGDCQAGARRVRSRSDTDRQRRTFHPATRNSGSLRLFRPGLVAGASPSPRTEMLSIASACALVVVVPETTE